MSEQIILHEKRTEVDRKYVGFYPNGSSVKPVHIAGGSLRNIYGRIANTKSIKRLSYVSNAKGVIPNGNDLQSVKSFLEDSDSLDAEVSESDLASLRNILQNLLSADKGVFSGTNDGMVSYTAGSKYFITGRALYEDAGEFIGSVIKKSCPELAEYISNTLSTANDPISILFSPVVSDETTLDDKEIIPDDLPAFKQKNSALEWYLSGLRKSGLCLLENLRKHPNPLTQLRLFNFYCIFSLIRYLTLLEAFYCDESIRPILLDFSSKSQSSVARASQMTYTQMHRAISRFYAWAYAKELNDFDIEELLKSATPIYDAGKDPKTVKSELDQIWRMAKEEAMLCETNNEARLILGAAMYDMLALEASSHPVNYIRALGTQAGILYPPDKLHPNKRFVLSQDVLEMILRSCVKPQEILNGTELRERLWEYFGIIIGGKPFEMERLQQNGAVLQIDEDSLENNFKEFVSALEAMDFAEVMADGILQIRLGGSKE